ncbi:MAG: hypothetical protein M1818_005674 [Claussenomyces sp. TS43310]|nr:MAG: hypothetical protein M1818_005674 [Claussenomyces sp. TS43310]
MQCDICSRTGGSRLPFLCPVDARNQLYEPRLLHARVLVERDDLDRQIQRILPGGAEGARSPAGEPETANEPVVAQNLAEQDMAMDRTRQIIAQADDLRTKIETARAEIARKKANISRRKSEYASAVNGLELRRVKIVEEIEKKTKMTRYKWNQMHGTTAESRAFLCGEAARLYGLERLRDPVGGWTDQYSIAGIPIMDLRSMNSVSAAQVTTSLSHMAHLLVLSTHYLAIRLPAEVTLPHRDYPLPTVLAISSSYTYTNLPFPGSTFSSSNNSPSSSRHTETSNLPRPRPLFITKPLPLLAKEDPSGYSLFLEGVTLLAYNIAWVCKSQNIPVGSSGTGPTSFEDICAIGHNMFALLIGSMPRPSPPSHTSSAQSTPSKQSRPRAEAADVEIEGRSNAPVAPIGQLSHGSAHNFLGSTSGNEFIRTFKLPNPTKIADKLKSQLLSELASAEWEVVDRDAWSELEGHAVDAEGDGVMVGARRAEPQRGSGHDKKAYRALLGGMGMREISDVGAHSFMSMKTVVDAVEIVDGETNERKPGTSGWTKIKPR